MRIGLLTQWYDPEPGPAALPGVLARELQRRGHEIQVLTGFPNYPTGEVVPGYRIRRRLDETLDGVAVRRVALYPEHGTSVLGRVANYASFGASAVGSGLDVLRGLDAIWVYNSPITVSWPMWAARHALGVPAVVHVLDLWPDSVVASGFSRSGRVFAAAETGLHRWCDAMYRSAESIAYISPGVGPILRARGVPAEKLRYLPMWADENIFRPAPDDLRDELGLDPAAVVLLYAGALGHAQGLDSLVEACTKIADPSFRCIVAGSGVCESSLRDRAERIGATNIRFLGRVPQSGMTSLMAAGDVNYIGLRPHALSPFTMPSKTQAALASGRALLAAADGDVADVVRQSGAGFVADPSDPASIADAVNEACAVGRTGLHAMGARGRTYYDRTFSVERSVPLIESMLADAAATGGRR